MCKEVWMGGLWVEGISPGGSGEGVRHVHLPGVTGDLCQSWKHPSALLDPGSQWCFKNGENPPKQQQKPPKNPTPPKKATPIQKT